MNLLEVIEVANGRKFIRKSEPNLIYRVKTCNVNHSGAIFEYVDLWVDEKSGNYVVRSGYVTIALPRIIADDWEVIDEKVE